LGGYLQILLNSPYRDSFASTSYWEFTVHQAVIDVIPDKFAASGKIVDSIGKETSFYVQYNSTAIPASILRLAWSDSFCKTARPRSGDPEPGASK
jgi:hypothetical protein